MHVYYLLIFLSLSSFGQAPKNIQVIPNPQSLEDFEHQNKGCPENSECDQVMGLQLTRWKELVKKLKDPGMEDKKKVQYLELFRQKYGIPVDFYTTKVSQQGFRPLYFNSHCKDHNPKKEEERILKGTAFIKSIHKDKAIVWRDQAQIEVPTDSLLVPQPVVVYFPEETKIYQLPLGDQPLFIKDKNLYVLKENEDLFFMLKVSPAGDWSIVDVDFSRLSEWGDKRDNITCPIDKKKTAPDVFGAAFCKLIWDEDLKKTVVVKMHQGCAN